MKNVKKKSFQNRLQRRLKYCFMDHYCCNIGRRRDSGKIVTLSEKREKALAM